MKLKNNLIKFFHIIGPSNEGVGGFLVFVIAVVVGLFVGMVTDWWLMAGLLALITLAGLMIAALWVYDD